MNRRFGLLPLGAALLGCLALLTESRALMVEISIADLVRQSSAIVIGHVQKTESFWRDGRIYTHATIARKESLLGLPDNATFVVEVPGGEVGEIGLKVSDMPAFAPGMEVFLFLRGTDRHVPSPASSIGLPVCSVVGQAQGQYIISSSGTVRRPACALLNAKTPAGDEVPVAALIATVRTLLSANRK